MSRADYAHHNEEQDRIWWEEEGKHSIHVDNYDPEIDDDYLREAKEDECQDDEEQEEEG